jgi:hypothetical protein
MKYSTKNHTAYYVSLILMLGLGFTLVMLSKGNPMMQKIAFIMTAFFYVVWGIVHHVVHHDTSVKVVIEYVLIGTVGICLALLLIR